MSDPTLLHTVMLLSASHCSSVRGPDVHAIDMIALRGWAIRGINQCLADRTRVASDELATAVLHMAWYEAISGDYETYSTHMFGLRQLVEHRGGLRAMGLNGLLEKMLLWIDSNGRYVLGFDHVFFPRSMFTSDYSHPSPDPQAFGAQRTLN